MSDYQTQINELSNFSKKSVDELNQMIEDQIKEMSGLIDKEGSIVIVARNLGYSKDITKIKSQETKKSNPFAQASQPKKEETKKSNPFAQASQTKKEETKKSNPFALPSQPKEEEIPTQPIETIDSSQKKSSIIADIKDLEEKLSLPNWSPFINEERVQYWFKKWVSVLKYREKIEKDHKDYWKLYGQQKLNKEMLLDAKRLVIWNKQDNQYAKIEQLDIDIKALNSNIQQLNTTMEKFVDKLRNAEIQ